MLTGQFHTVAERDSRETRHHGIGTINRIGHRANA
jgi:hypothetical protein